MNPKKELLWGLWEIMIHVRSSSKAGFLGYRYALELDILVLQGFSLGSGAVGL